MTPPLSKRQKRKKKLEERNTSNRIIFGALKRLGVKYVHGMDMRAATHIVANAFELNVPDRTNKVMVANALRELVHRNPTGPVEQPKPTPSPPRQPSKKSRKRLQIAPSGGTLEARIRAFYDSWEWKRLSYDVKQERGRKCECCAAGAPQVRIVTDHIKPLRHYWELRLTRSNLQVLCDDCNMGKGSRDETDFRAAG